MGLTSSLSIGRTALSASQVAIQVAGNNFANAATPGYSRQRIGLSPLTGTRLGNSFVGRGVGIDGIRRSVDTALQARLWSGISQQAGAQTKLELLSTVEATLNELTDQDLSSELTRFFNSWSELASSPGAEGTRSLVVQQGVTLSGFMRSLRADLTATRQRIDGELGASVQQADALLSEIASLNAEIVQTEAGTGQANALRDQRDSLIEAVSEYIDITPVERETGAVDVLIGSTPVVLGGSSRGIELETESLAGEVSVSVRLRSDGTELPAESGRIGALLGQRETLVNDTVGRLDRLAAQLIFQVNRAHSTGVAEQAMTGITGTRGMPPADRTRALNDPANEALASLPFGASNGSFQITVTNAQTGASETVTIDVDLDGIDSSGAPGFGDDTSLEDIALALNAVPNLNATINADGQLQVNAAEGYEFGFGEDTSGALAVLGVNTYFTGSTAADIAVRQELQTSPTLLATGQRNGQEVNDNGVALAIAGLQSRSLGALNGSSISGAWQEAVQSIGMRTQSAITRADASTLVRENLEAQRAAVSGVSLDEESIDLVTYQRQYQGAARFISVIDELTQTLINLI